MIRFEDLLERVRSYTSDEEREFLRRAYVFSALEHKGQVRHSGEPYLVHPLEVASILADMRLDPVAIAAGLLHDVVEDTLTTIEKIQEHFGPEVAHVVEGVTKISAIPFSSSEERQAENFRKMLLAMVDDIRVILVKLADRLHNMRTLEHMSEDRRVRTAQETLDIYAPIANRLGMSKIKNELEELSFKYLDPEGYEALSAKVESRRQAVEVEIEDLKKTITAKLSEAQVPVLHVDGRLKRLYSINQKLKRQRIELDQVYDFVALRIITDSVKDCYAALGIIHQTWSPVPGRIKDFIAMPRPNGYQSLHTSVISERGVPFEVQIRTEEMHRHAEEGIAAHWKYKEGRIGDPSRRAALPVDPPAARSAAGSPRPARVHPEPQSRSVSRRGLHLHAERAGESLSARRDAGRFRLRHSHRHRPSVRRRARERQDGAAAHPPAQRRHRRDRDQRRPQAEPRLAQLRGHVEGAQQDQALRAGRRAARSVELGRRLLEKEARRFDLNPNTLFESEAFKKLSADYGPGDEIFAEIGYGKVQPRKVLARLVPQDQLKEKAPPRFRGRHRRAPAAWSRRRQDQGARHRRPDGGARALLQSDPRRSHRRLHHARARACRCTRRRART